MTSSAGWESCHHGRGFLGEKIRIARVKKENVSAGT